MLADFRIGQNIILILDILSKYVYCCIKWTWRILKEYADIYLVVYFIKIILPGFKGLEARFYWIENLVVYQSASEK